MTATSSLRDVLWDGTKEVFESMVFMSVAETEDDMPPSAEVTLLGTITFTGSLEGCLSVCCAQTCARTIAANMLCMESPDELSDEDVVDAIGEIANMVMGSVKTGVQDHIEGLTISIPSVVQGRELSTRLSEGTTRLVVNTILEQEHHATFSLVYRETGASDEEG